MRAMSQPPPPPLRFRKMHGAGNDFLVIDARDGRPPLAPEVVRALGDRHRGVGFDQFVEIRRHPEADALLAFRNADGSSAGACGNATRCVADLLMREAGREAVMLRSVAGALPARRRADGRAEVNMGAPRFDWREVPLAEAADTLALPIPGAPTAVSMGNPHAVLFVPDAEAAPVTVLGPELERHPIFPDRANIGFAQVIALDRMRLRVWERGAGLTLACGSGACAAVAAAVRRGQCGRTVAVEMDGGTLGLDWREDGIHMTGPVAEVFEGEVSAVFLAALGVGAAA